MASGHVLWVSDFGKQFVGGYVLYGWVLMKSFCGRAEENESIFRVVVVKWELFEDGLGAIDGSLQGFLGGNWVEWDTYIRIDAYIYMYTYIYIHIYIHIYIYKWS